MITNSVFDEIKWHLKNGTVLTKLIWANIFVFLFFQIIHLFLFFAQQTNVFENIVSYFSLNANVSIFIYRFWTIITYFFLQIDLSHLFFNMLGLYWFGKIVEDLIGKPKVLPIYILGGIAGGILFLLAYNLIPIFKNNYVNATLLGSSASVLAMVLAAATISPDYEMRLFLFGNIKLKWIAFFYIVIDLITIPYGNAGGHIAHLGGAFMGWFIINRLQNGLDITNWLYQLTDFFSNLTKKEKKLKTEYVNPKPPKEKSNINSTKQKQLDVILDKIGKSGYDSLSKEEKEFLFKVSKEV